MMVITHNYSDFVLKENLSGIQQVAYDKHLPEKNTNPIIFWTDLIIIKWPQILSKKLLMLFFYDTNKTITHGAEQLNSNSNLHPRQGSLIEMHQSTTILQ